MINARGISKLYGGVAALASVDLTLARGRVLGLVGTNGSGRTTLLKVLATQLKPSSGQVEIDGVDIIKHPFRARPKIGYLPQSQTFYDYMTVREFLKFVMACRNEKSGAGKLAAEAKQPFDGLSAEMPLRSLSHGLRQKLALTAALIPNPFLLLLDEPLNHLDPIAAVRFHQLIKNFQVQGGTVVMACNRTSDVAALCDEVAFMHQGRLLKTVRTEGLDADLAEVFRRLVEQNSGTSVPAGSAALSEKRS
jgi:ABC-2 type transport system ATP-binding protein